MWRAGNIPAAILLLVGIVVGPLASLSHAQSNDNLDAPRLHRAEARQAHRLVESWVQQGEVPDTPDKTLRVTGHSGIRVTLWRSGIAHGSGEAYPEDLAAVTDQPGPAVDIVPLLAEATRQALAGVRETLDEATSRARMADADLDEAGDGDAAFSAVTGNLLVSVQLGRTLETIRLHDDAELNEVYAHLAPGHHGIRVTAAGDTQRTAVLWPAAVLERNLSPRGQLTHLLSATGHDLQSIARLGRRDGPRLTRFDVLHVVRPRQDWPVVDLVRGSELLPPHIDEATLDGLVYRLGNHLERRFTADGLVRGTYHPTRNTFDPPIAQPEDAALAVYATTRHTGYLRDVGDTAQADERLARAQVVAERLAQWVLDDPDEAEPGAVMATASLTLLSLVDAPSRTGEQREMRDALGRWLVDRLPAGEDHQRQAAVDAPEQGGHANEGQAGHALAVAALASLYAQQRDPALAAVVLQQMQRFTEVQPGVAAFGWRAIAYDRMQPLLDGPQASEQRAAARSLAQMGQAFLRRQVTRPPSLGPADVVGGFELRRAARDAPPSPDWSTSHVLMFQAIAIRSATMLEDEQTIDWLLSAGLAGRFLAQLVVDEPSAYNLRSPADALGGVRLAPWDNRQSVAAQAMTLLAITELQAAMKSLTQRGL